RSLYETYFPSEGSGAFEEICYALRKAGEKISFSVPFSALLHLFEKTSNISSGSSLLHAARFSSLEMGASIPSRALFLIGFDEESFPRRPPLSSLNLCRKFEEAPPFASELDRYLFLQAVCSAQDLLVISYRHISAEDGKELNPSIVLQELERYVKQIEITTHPSFPLARRCFEEPSCRRMSHKEYEAARLFYAPKQPLPFFSPFRSPKLSEELPHKAQSISLKELNSFFRNPWKYYLQKAFRLWVDEPKKEDWLDFELTPQKRAHLLKGGLYQPLDKLVDRSEKKREFPVGLFGQIASSHLAQTNVEWKEHLQAWGLQEELISEKIIVEIFLEEARIIGIAKHCSCRGPLHFGEDSFVSLLKNWPEYLAVLCSLGAHEIFCVRSGHIKTVSSPREELKKCIELHSRGMQTPLPFISQWADALVRRNSAAELEKAFSSDLGGWEDPVYEWIAARARPFSAETLVDEWGSYLQKHLQALVDLYPVRGKE
ncbi:MAG: exodeoxyribonuclease V subunit gamma, partial [Chlamydiales bacterium]|nr:exodeoxyribonuclease V subunit gamma [Chlamydiales bacterium]